MIIKYADHDNSSVRIMTDDTEVFVVVPVDPDNADWQEIVASGVTIAPFVGNSATADDVRSEAQRRMIALVGARDAAHLDVLIANGSREAIRLMRIKIEREWTYDEAVRAAQLEAIDASIEAIRAASNAMETVPPVDYADDSHWP